MTDKSQTIIAERDVNVHGDLIHGDKVDGDKVSGDYIRVNIGDNAQNVIVGKDNQIIISSSGTIPLYVNVPAMPNYFFGREELIDFVTQQLVSQQHLAFSTEGLPGVGKTTLAVAIAHRIEVVEHFVDGVLWFGLGQQADVNSSLASWAEALGIDASNLKTTSERAQAIKSAIGQRKFLIVIDDAWGIEEADYLRCGGPNCCHILTTRNQDIAQAFAGGKQVISVPVLDDETSYQLLQKLAPKACEADPEIAQQLIRAVGGLPLTLKLLGGYLALSEHSRYPELSKAAFSQMLNPQVRLQLAAQRLGSLNDPKVSLQKTIMLSLEDDSLPKEAVSTFYALGAFAPKPAHFDRSAAEAIAETNLATLAVLASRNLLDDTQGLEQLALHQELANVASTQTLPEAIERHRVYYLNLVNENQEDWQRIASVYGQIKWAWAAAPEDSELINWLWMLTTFQRRRGLWNDMIDWIQRALDLAKSQGWQSEEAKLLNNLGLVYKNQGRWEEAMHVYTNGLHICKILNDRDGEAQILNNIGVIYKNQGRWEDAIHIFENCLHLFKELGNKFGTSRTLINLGIVYTNLGRWQEAVDVYKDSLRISSEIGDREGEDYVLNNLGLVYKNQGRWEEAIYIFENSLHTKRILGNRHSESQTLTNLGSVYCNQGRWNDAIQVYAESLRISTELGDRHGISQATMGLGLIYNMQGRLAEAIQMFEDSLHTKRMLSDRQGESQTLSNLGLVYHNQGKWEEAIQVYKESLHISNELGDKHGMGQSMNGFGTIYADQGRWQEAIQMFENSLHVYRELHDHHWEGIAIVNLSSVYYDRGQEQKALETYQTALAKLHPDSPEYKDLIEWLQNKTDLSSVIKGPTARI